MRDLYHRRKRLAYWIKRIDTDPKDPDRTDVLKLVEHMQDRERAILWITRCITAILLIKKQLDKPFRNATNDDIKSILRWMEQKGYKGSTNEKFRQVLKLFYKTVYRNNEFYPEQVKWFSVKLGKEKSGGRRDSKINRMRTYSTKKSISSLYVRNWCQAWIILTTTITTITTISFK